MQLLDRRARRGSELVAEPKTQLVVGPQCLRTIAPAVERQHQPAVARLPERSDLHEGSGRTLGRVQLRTADLETGVGSELQALLVCVPEAPAMLVEPGRVVASQQLSRRDVLDDSRRPPRRRPVAADDRSFRAVQRLAHGLDVDPGVVGQRQAELRPTVERQETSKLGDERGHGRVGRGGRLVPERFRELVSKDEAAAIQHQIRKDEPPLPTRKIRLDLATGDLGGEAAAEVDTCRQAVAKVTTTSAADTARMSKILVNITNGPEHPTRAALAFLVARAAQDAGHDVSLFLAGDAVQLLRPPVLDSLVGLGTGSLRESYDALHSGGASWYVSGKSSQARGFEPDGVAETAMPSKLIELSLEADRVLTY